MAYNFNTNLLLPNDTSAPGQTINLSRLTNQQAINRLISQGYMDQIVLLARRCYANAELNNGGRVICGTGIKYSCPARDQGILNLSVTNTLQIATEIINNQTPFAQLVNLIFRYGMQLYRQGVYLQKGQFVNCMNQL